jgi:hypothetical protein
MIAVSGKDKIMSERQLTAAAQRALAEAEERRKAKAEAKLPKEVNGRPGPEPTRFGDWENKGIASDF